MNIPHRDIKLLPWSEKYRPSQLDNIIHHDKIKHSLANFMKCKKLPHLLFYGPPGTGKTSSIIAFAKYYYKEDYDDMVLILNASEERGIETVRNRIKQFVISLGNKENADTPDFKMIILDEIDAMTEDAQAILRKVVEKYVSNVRFCFICNYLKKINPAIQSRCVIFRFNPITYDKMYEYVINICNTEKINVTKKALDLIVKKANGDMRKLLNILQSLYMHNFINKETDVIIKEDNVSSVLSCPTESNIINFIKYVQKNKLKDSYNYIYNIVNKSGISVQELITYIYEYYNNLIINETCVDNKYRNIINKLAIINENLTYCNNENIQLISLVSIFYM
jgi:replication factor C subunit 3/5